MENIENKFINKIFRTIHSIWEGSFNHAPRKF